jgi:hypothetical protein
MAPAADPLAELLVNYNDLNASVVDELHEEPSPLEFMRYVSRNTPFVVRGAANTWKATRTWNLAYLKDLLCDQAVNVAVTPYGFVPSRFLFPFFSHVRRPQLPPRAPGKRPNRDLMLSGMPTLPRWVRMAS